MADPFRSGGFGTPGFGPFQTGGGGDSRYLIANDGNNVASMRRYSAQVAWANGTITDAAYLEAMRRYVGTTDKGSRDRISAQNEYEDAVYSVGRNKLVRDINNAGSANLRASSLRRLITYDSRKLATMSKDNEQYRELKDRIADSTAQVREVRWGELVRRFNRDQVSTSAMLSFARNAAASSAGGPDHSTWQDRVVEYQGRIDTDRINGLYQDYQMGRIPGQTVVDALQHRLAGMSPDAPQYAETQRSIEDLTKQITEKARSDKDQKMYSGVKNGTVSDIEYLDYLKNRVKDYAVGTADRRAAADNFLQARFSYGEAALNRQVQDGTSTTADLVDFYRGYMATMDPGASRFIEMQQKVSDLLVGGTAALALWSTSAAPGGGGGSGSAPGGYAGVGHYIDMSGAPGGTPVNAAGFASQFDGSAFASTNCGMASAAMLAWAATDGKLRLSGGDLRYYSGDRDTKGDERGTTYDDVTRAFEQVGLGLVQRHGMAFEAWKRRLARGEGSLISGVYSVVPSNLSNQPGYGGTHTMYVDRAKKFADGWYFYVMDPLVRGGKGGRWWPESVVKAYGWSNIANAGGGTWFGDVAFAGKKGRSATYISPDRGHPPIQAFDTDANGNSTVGRGGGTNRQEAGPRQDWSNGRANAKGTGWDTTGEAGGTGIMDASARAKIAKGTPGGARVATPVTDSMVAEFLAAVDSTKRPSPTDLAVGDLFPKGQGASTQADREARARSILTVNGGDARLAAVAWFTQGASAATGGWDQFKANPDTTTWDSSARFYANAVGTRLGYEPVTKGTAVTTASGTIVRGATGTITPTTSPSGLIVTGGARPVAQQGGARIEGLAPAAADIATKLLTKLGVEASPDMVRAVVAWMSTEGDKVNGNNPFVLRTTGTMDLPGQLAKDDTGLAVFGSMDAGIAAAAAEIKRSQPGLIAAMRTGDPERFLVTLDRSSWVQGGYGGTLIRTFNEMPGGDRTLIGGTPGLLQGETSLSGLARVEPSIAELFDVDPRDPAQMVWLDANVKAAKDAQTAGASTWDFVTPGGQTITLDFSPAMTGDLLGTKALYLDWTAAQLKHTSSREDYGKALAAAGVAHAERDANVSEVAYDEYQARYDALDAIRQHAIGGGDYATYLTATNQMIAATNILLGEPPDAPLDVNAAAYITRFANHREDLANIADALAPRSADNLAGDPIRQLADPTVGGINIGWDGKGNITSASADPSMVYSMFNDGKLEIRTFLTHPEDFVLADIPTDTLTGQATQQPKYVQSLGYMVMPDGTGGYVQKSSAALTGWVLEAGGYRTIPAPAIPQPGPSAGSIGSASGGYSARQANYPGFVGDASTKQGFGTPQTFNVSPWQMQGNPRPGSITSVTRQDQLVTRLPGAAQVGVDTMTVVWNGKQYTMYSIPGSHEWMGGVQSRLDDAAPRLVVSKESGATVINGVLTIGGKPYDPATNGSLGQFMHWYGTRPEDGAGMNLGAEHGHLKLRKEAPGAAPGGGSLIDLAAPDTTTAFLEGDISFDALVGASNRAVAKAMRQGYRGTSVVTPDPGAPQGTIDPRRANLTKGPESARIGRVLADNGVDFSQFGSTSGPFDPAQLALIAQLPVTAGGRDAPVATTRTNSMFNLSDRLASSVNAGASAVLSAARAQQQAAAARAEAQARLDRVAAAQAAADARAKAAQTTTYTAPAAKPGVWKPVPGAHIGPNGVPTFKPTVPVAKPTVPANSSGSPDERGTTTTRTTPQQHGNY